MSKMFSDAYGDIFNGSDLAEFVKITTKFLSKAEEIKLMLTGAVSLRKGKVTESEVSADLFGIIEGSEADILYLKKYNSCMFSPIISQEDWLSRARAYMETIGVHKQLIDSSVSIIKEEGYLNVWSAFFFALRILANSVDNDETIMNYHLAVILEADTNDVLLDAVEGVSLVQCIIYLAASTIRHKMTHNELPFAVYHEAFFKGYLDKIHFVTAQRDFVGFEVDAGKSIEEAILPFLQRKGVLKIENIQEVL